MQCARLVGLATLWRREISGVGGFAGAGGGA